jgi:hypothetical protein
MTVGNQYGGFLARARRSLARLRRLLLGFRRFAAPRYASSRMFYAAAGHLVRTERSDGRVESATWGANCCGQQKSAKPKRLAAPGDRDFEAARQRGARSGIPRRSGNESETAADGTVTVYGYNELKQKVSETRKGLAPDGSDDNNATA